MNDGEQSTDQQEERIAGAPEGAVQAEPSTDEIKGLYDELGIKASVPSGKAKGRPKAANVRNKNASKDASGNSDAGKQGDENDEGEQADAPDAGKNGSAGNGTDKKGSKEQSSAAKVSESSAEADGGVRDSESRDEEDSKRGSEENADAGNNSAGQEQDKSESSEEEGKRPGKSNPEVEKRFQKLTSEVKERDQVISDLQKKLQDTTRQQEQAKFDAEDPEYSVEDFRKVRDEDGNVLELDQNQAELAWRRWKDGYDQRKAERNADVQRRESIQKAQQDHAEQVMRDSVEAYDSLTSILDTYPELNTQSGQFDKAFSDAVMPVIEEVIVYQDGTEPGNPDNNQPIIVGMKMNPKIVLDAIKKVSSAKRSLPLNGVDDNVETRSNVNVPHSRSSDPNVTAANELYQTLGIKKRI